MSQARTQIPSQAAPPIISTRQARRPGLVTFAAVLMFTLAGFFTVAAITELSNSAWLFQRNFTVAGSHLVFWGFVDGGLALLSAVAGYLLLTGHASGQVIGFLFAGVGMVRWLFYIPADPWLALAIVAMDGLVLYGLAANDQWFSESA